MRLQVPTKKSKNSCVNPFTPILWSQSRALSRQHNSHLVVSPPCASLHDPNPGSSTVTPGSRASSSSQPSHWPPQNFFTQARFFEPGLHIFGAPKSSKISAEFWGLMPPPLVPIGSPLHFFPQLKKPLRSCEIFSYLVFLGTLLDQICKLPGN